METKRAQAFYWVVAAILLLSGLGASGIGSARAGALPSPAAQAAGERERPEQGSPWKRYKLTGTGLFDVDAASANDAWAVGTDGLFAHWDGAAWNAVDNSKLVGTSTVLAVDMAASNAAWASASGGRMFRYDGAAWAQETSNFAASMNSISMLSATDGWAAGSAATFAHYTGTTWVQVQASPALTVPMYGIDMVSANDGWAVGGTTPPREGPLGKIARYNGTSWQEFPSPVTNRILYDVDMLDATYGWAVGQSGTLLQWNGAAWTQGAPPASCQLSCGAANLEGVHVNSRTDAWAVGSTNISAANLWHWDGAVWTALTAPFGAPLNSVTFLPGTQSGWAVGDRGTIYKIEGNTVTISNSHWVSYGFYGIDFIGPNDGWAVGVLNQDPPAYGLHHWNGTDWTPMAPPEFRPTMYDVDMVASDAVWAVGTVGYVFHWNGAAWTRDTSPADASLYALSMVSATDGWAVGGSGRIVHWDGTAWTYFTSNTTTNLWSISMVNANEGWAGGTSGLMLHYQNGTWTPISPNPSGFTIEGIQMLNANEGWAVGYNGTILHYLNGAWTPQTSPTNANLLNVHMISPNEGWAVGSPAVSSGNAAPILHYLNGAWSLVTSPTGRPLRDVYMFDANNGWAVGEAPGPILRFGGDVPVQTVTPTAVSSMTGTATSVATTTSTTVSTTTRTATASMTRTATTIATMTVTGTAATGTDTPTRMATATSTSTARATSTITATRTPIVIPTCTISFSDVAVGSTFYDFVRCLYCRGAIGGYSDGTFRPDAHTTRGQLAKIAILAFGFIPIDPATPTFSDVPRGSTFYTYVEAAAQLELIGGYADGTYRPNSEVTRGQLSKIIVIAAIRAYGWTLLNPPTATFVDVPRMSTFYEYIETAVCHGIIGGYNDGAFRPNANATRGQISKIACLAVRNEGVCRR